MARQIQASVPAFIEQRLVYLVSEFLETEIERTQEFTLRWSDGTGTGRCPKVPSPAEERTLVPMDRPEKPRTIKSAFKIFRCLN